MIFSKPNFRPTGEYVLSPISKTLHNFSTWFFPMYRGILELKNHTRILCENGSFLNKTCYDLTALFLKSKIYFCCCNFVNKPCIFISWFILSMAATGNAALIAWLQPYFVWGNKEIYVDFFNFCFRNVPWNWNFQAFTFNVKDGFWQKFKGVFPEDQDLQHFCQSVFKKNSFFRYLMYKSYYYNFITSIKLEQIKNY